MIEMMFSTQQTMMKEMTRPTKCPLTIKKTQLMQWTTTETIWKPTKNCLWADYFFVVVGFFDPDLPFFFSIADIFCGVDWLFFVKVSSMNDCLTLSFPHATTFLAKK
jgi:hypothetical protein